MQKTKFDHVIASLSPEVAVEIRDLILKPPTDHPFDVLRRELIRKSEQHKLQQLFTAEQIGDRKPTQLLRQMEQLMGDHATSTDSAFLRELFLQRLPSQVRMVLASADDSVSLAQLAQLADKILEVAVPSSVASVETPSSLASDVEQLRAQVSELQETIKNLRRPSRPPRPPSLSRSCSPRPTSPVSLTLCWYHQKYGDAATKCKTMRLVKRTGHTLVLLAILQVAYSSSRTRPLVLVSSLTRVQMSASFLQTALIARTSVFEL